MRDEPLQLEIWNCCKHEKWTIAIKNVKWNLHMSDVLLQLWVWYWT